VEELEKRLENSSTATAQKQLQLDTMQQALEKLKRQVDRIGHIRFSFVGRKGRTYLLQLDTLQQALEKLKRQVDRNKHIRFSFVGR
jgi:ribosomal protein S21